MEVRPIDADSLKEHIKKLDVSIAYEDQDKDDVINQICGIIDNFLTLTGVNVWVSVEESLPEDMGDVLVVAFWHECWQTMIGWCGGKMWRVYTSHGEMVPSGVTHWMPLPEPPESRKEQQKDGSKTD